MLSTGASSVGGDDGTWKVAAFDKDILRVVHGDDSGVQGGERGRFTRVRRWATGEAGGGIDEDEDMMRFKDSSHSVQVYDTDSTSTRFRTVSIGSKDTLGI